MNKRNHIQVRPCTLKDLAAGYGISYKTLKAFLRPHEKAIGPRSGRYFTTLQVKTIYELIGPPGDYMEE